MSHHGSEPIRAIVAAMADRTQVIGYLYPGQPDPSPEELASWGELYRISGDGQDYDDDARNWGLPVEVTVQTIKGNNPWAYMLDNIEYLKIANRPFTSQNGSQNGSNGVYVSPAPDARSASEPGLSFDGAEDLASGAWLERLRNAPDPAEELVSGRWRDQLRNALLVNPTG